MPYVDPSAPVATFSGGVNALDVWRFVFFVLGLLVGVWLGSR